MFVDTETGLEKLVDSLSDAPVIALDTEFVRERTFFPKLCLVQIAGKDIHACVDPLAISNLDPLLDLIYDSRVTKVLHSARQDLEILFRLRDSLPTPIFDTQIAADLAGLGEQISYGAMVEQLLSIRLDKTATRTNWSRRPLSDQQIQYAENDVIYLLQAYHELEKNLPNRMQWALQDSEELTRSELYSQDLASAYKRIKGIAKIGTKARAAVQRLAAWREKMAMQRDLPRRWVLDDKLLLAMAKENPGAPSDLIKLGAPKKLVQQHGPTLLELLLAECSSDETPKQNRILDQADRDKLKAMKRIVDSQSQALNVSSALLASKRDLIALLHGEGSRLIHGWRHSIIGMQLMNLIEDE